MQIKIPILALLSAIICGFIFSSSLRADNLTGSNDKNVDVPPASENNTSGNAMTYVLIAGVLLIGGIAVYIWYNGDSLFKQDSKTNMNNRRDSQKNSGTRQTYGSQKNSGTQQHARTTPVQSESLQGKSPDDLLRETAELIVGKAKKIMEGFEQQTVENFKNKMFEIERHFATTTNNNRYVAENFQKILDDFNDTFGWKERVCTLEKENAELKNTIDKNENPYEAIIPSSVVKDVFNIGPEKIQNISPALRIAIREWCCFADWANETPDPAGFKTEFRKLDNALVSLRREDERLLDRVRESLRTFIAENLPSKLNAGIEISWDFKGREFSSDKNYSSDGGGKTVKFVVSAYYNIKGFDGEKAKVECE